MKSLMCLIVAALALGCAALADDVTGADPLLCSAGRVAVCVDGIECASAFPDDLSVPRVVQIDLKAKRLETTAASAEYRTTDSRKCFVRTVASCSRATRTVAPSAS